MKIYAVADLHFGHKNIIKFEKRPFKEVEEMDASLIEQWNNIVGENDQVYILGDFTLKGSNYACDILKQLKGTKFLILGNHDNFVRKKDFPQNMFEEITNYKEIEYNGKHIIMSHYPIADWNEKEYGSILLYGHIHNIKNDAQKYMKDQFLKGYKCYNVGWDVEHRLFNLEEFANERKN